MTKKNKHKDIQLTFDDFVQNSSDNLLHKFKKTECDSDWEIITGTVHGAKDIILNSETINLNKNELMKIVSESPKRQKHNYTWIIYFKEDNKYYRLSIRFGNNTTKSLSTEEFIHRYFTVDLKDKL